MFRCFLARIHYPQESEENSEVGGGIQDVVSLYPVVCLS